jgi:hypothetical protein
LFTYRPVFLRKKPVIEAQRNHNASIHPGKLADRLGPRQGQPGISHQYREASALSAQHLQ